MSAFQQTIHRFFADESGSSMVEEALILAVMVIAVMFGIMQLTNTLQGGITGAAGAIGDAIPAS
jgi:Flp pilus assembly pilin Flp